MAEHARDIETEVSEAVRIGPLAGAVEEIQIEPAMDDNQEEFLRIKLIVNLPDRDVDAELEAMLERIEDAVARVDHRYASVRFLDAA